MLRWVLAFFVFAVFAALLGFTGIAGGWRNMAWIMAGLFLIVFIASLVLGSGSSTEQTAEDTRRINNREQTYDES